MSYYVIQFIIRILYAISYVHSKRAGMITHLKIRSEGSCVFVKIFIRSLARDEVVISKSEAESRI